MERLSNTFPIPRTRRKSASASAPFYLFPYREEEEVKGRRLLRPTLDVEVGDQPTKALIDTGARRCYFARGIGEANRVEFGPLVPKETVEIAGAPREIVIADIQLTLASHSHLSWQAPVAFFVEEWDLAFGILGHDGFLDRYVVSFNYSANYFVIEEPSHWEERAPVDPFEEYMKEGDPQWQPPPGY